MSRRLTTAEFVSKAEKVHNGKYDYSLTVYVDSRTKLTIICPKHGPFEQQAASHLSGCGCPDCQKEWSDEHIENLRKSCRASRGMTTDEWIAKAKAVHGDKYDYSQTVYVNQRTNVKIICPLHGLFEQKADSHIRGFGCKKCGNMSAAHIGVHNWSDEQRAKTASTCLQKYGAPRYLDSQEGVEKIALIKSTPEFRNRMRDIISSDAVQAKTRQTSMAKYGTASPAQTKAVQDKIYNTKKKNHTVNSSKAEVFVYDMLVDRFGVDDITHQYKDDRRYPFACDFYVKSLDLFIELNLHWSHGHHWFGSCDGDLAELDRWKMRSVNGSEYYAVAISTWTLRDIKKRDTAILNSLNYVVFWRNDLSDFKAWFADDVLILNNI